MKKQYFVDQLEGVVYVDPAFLKAAGQIDTAECTLFETLRKKYPEFRFEKKELNKSSKQTYGGLSIRVMQAFIIQYEDTPEKVNEALKALNKKKAEGLLKGATYGVVKSWFLDKYGKVYNNSELAQKDSKRDALIKELLAKVDKKAIDNSDEKEQKGEKENG